MYHSLGPIQFEGAFGIEALTRSGEARYAEHATIEGKPSLQRLGPKLDTMQLTIRLHREFCVPEDEILRMDTFRLDGEVLALTTGAGDLRGSFVIESINEEQRQAATDGSIIEAVVTLGLKEWASADSAADRAVVDRESAFALAANDPPVVVDPDPVQTVESEAMSDALSTGGEADLIGDRLASLDSNPSTSAHERGKIADALSRITEQANKSKAAVDGLTGDKFNDTRDMSTALATLAAAATAMKILVPSDTVANLRTKLDQLRSTYADLRSKAQQLQKFVSNRN